MLEILTASTTATPGEDSFGYFFTLVWFAVVSFMAWKNFRDPTLMAHGSAKARSRRVLEPFVQEQYEREYRRAYAVRWIPSLIWIIGVFLVAWLTIQRYG